MLGMIRKPMLTTPLFRAWVEGEFDLYISRVFFLYTLRFVYISTHKIVGITTVSRPEHRVAQTHELECTKKVLPQVIERGK